MKRTAASTDGKTRCPWSEGVSPAYLEYHDCEWGVPVHDDRKQFEFLILEGAQAGLSWSTVLHRRAGYRRAFADFDPHKVARFTPARIEKLLLDPGIIRNRLKVNAAVSNAHAFLELQAEFGSFDRYIWGFVDGRPVDQPLAQAVRGAGNQPGLGCAQQGHEETRLPLRRQHDSLRAPAGHRPHQ